MIMRGKGEEEQVGMSAMPLQGIRVIDLSRVLAGPFCGQMLADYGADVIKIEPPGGDQSRFSGPPYMNDGSTAMYSGLNRNKRGMALDLAFPEGKAILLDLIEEADVLIENFKPGTMARWGLGYEDLRERFPRLIMLSISGFGATGPLGGVPGYDGTVAAWTGIIASNGSQQTGPMRLGVSIVDVSAGLHGTIGVLLALAARQRTGKGQLVDVSLFDSALPILHPHAANWLECQSVTPLTGNLHPTFSPFGLFQARDRMIYLAVSSDRMFRSLCEVIGRPAMASDPRFETSDARADNRMELKEELEAALKDLDSLETVARLNEAGVPVGPIMQVSEALALEHTKHRGMMAELDGYRGVGIPVKLSQTPGHLRRRPPAFSEHTAEILSELGKDAQEIQALRARGVTPSER